MNTCDKQGFSFVKLILIIFSCGAVVAAGLFGISYFNKNEQLRDASSFTSEFIEKIKNNDASESFKLFGNDLKTEDTSSSYYAWLFWTLPLSESSVEIEVEPESIVYSNSSFLNTSKNDAAIKFTYATSENASIFFNVMFENNQWVIVDYGTL